MRSASRTAAPRAIHSAGLRSCAAASAPSSANAAYTSVRFVYCHESSGDADQRVVKPTQTASEKSATRNAAPAESSIGAGSAPTSAAAAATAASRSATPPSQTSEDSVAPRAKNNVANANAAADIARTAPAVARTGADASIVKTPRPPRSQTVYMGQTARTLGLGRLGRGMAGSDV